MTPLARTGRLTGPELKSRRLDAELRQDDLAAVLNVNRSRIAAIEALAAPSRAATRRYLAAIATAEADR